MPEIRVGGEQDEVVRNAQLRNEGVNRLELHTLTAAGVAQLCCGNVICARLAVLRQAKGSPPKLVRRRPSASFYTATGGRP
jgi:hypothetical protein